MKEMKLREFKMYLRAAIEVCTDNSGEIDEGIFDRQAKYLFERLKLNQS